VQPVSQAAQWLVRDAAATTLCSVFAMILPSHAMQAASKFAHHILSQDMPLAKHTLWHAAVAICLCLACFIGSTASHLRHGIWKPPNTPAPMMAVTICAVAAPSHLNNNGPRLILFCYLHKDAKIWLALTLLLLVRWTLIDCNWSLTYLFMVLLKHTLLLSGQILKPHV